jgi:RNA polymerase sigma factor (sigma-70 family)
MKNYQNSDYALNKHSGGIVYRFADGSRFTITPAAYLAENPDKTEADFLALKSFSDEDYHERDKAEYRQTWKDAPDEAERQRNRASIAKEALDKLTDVQRRWYLLYHAEGYNEVKIGKLEGATHQAVSKTLSQAEKKIKKFLAGS